MSQRADKAILNSQVCTQCSGVLETQARFCGSCGYLINGASKEYEQYQNHIVNNATPKALPSFAIAGIPHEGVHTNELIQEANKLLVLLARERLFLYMHCSIFIAVNLFGFWVAWKSYTGFIGDEMTKIVVACTPFLFINSVALVGLTCISGTRKEIARLKERLSYIHFKLEFDTIIN